MLEILSFELNNSIYVPETIGLASQLVKDLVKLHSAWMNTDILETGSSEGLRAEVALDLQLRAVKFDVVVKSLHRFNRLVACVAYYFETLTFVDHVFVEVREEHMLVVLLLLAPVAYLYLSKHLLH